MLMIFQMIEKTLIFFQGADPAKTLLFQSCQQRPPSLQGVLALCVLGIKQKNPTLVQAALSEMDQHKDSGKADTVAMKALVMTLQGKESYILSKFSKDSVG